MGERSAGRGGGSEEGSDRLVIPVRDADGRLTGVVTRDLVGLADDLFTPAGPAVDRARLVYGLDLAREAIRREDHVIVVEDYLDVWRGHQAGIENLVTSIGTGTGLTLEQLGLIQPHTEMIVGFTPAGWAPPADEPLEPGELRRVEVAGGHRFQGSFSHRCLESRHVGRRIPYSVLLPAPALHRGRRIPVLLFLQALERIGTDALNAMLDRMMASGSLAPMAVVTASGERSLYLDRRDGTASWERLFLDELIPTVHATLEAVDPARTGLIGASMGGLGVLRMAFKHPGRFAAVTAHAPAIDPALTWAETPAVSVLSLLRPSQFMEELYGHPIDADGYWTQNNPAWLAQRNAAAIRQSGLELYLDCGTADTLAKDGTMFLHRILETHGIRHEMQWIQDARHNRAFFSIAMLQGFHFLSEALTRRER